MYIDELESVWVYHVVNGMKIYEMFKNGNSILNDHWMVLKAITCYYHQEKVWLMILM